MSAVQKEWSRARAALADAYSDASLGLYKRGRASTVNQRNRPNLAAENEPGSTRRAALYLRVSTGRQAEHDLSIPDQRTQLQSWTPVRHRRQRSGVTVLRRYLSHHALACPRLTPSR